MSKTSKGIRCKTEITHILTQEEFKQKTLDMNRKVRECELKSEHAKAIAATTKSEIKILQAQVSELRNHLDEGAERVQVESVCHFDRKAGKKTFYRHAPGQDEDGQKLKTEPMTEMDYQIIPAEDEGE